jgi:ADP-heptose:LPS heptosyltransferase
VDQLHELLSPLGIASTDTRTPLLFAPDHSQNMIRDKLHHISRYLLIHHGASWPTKRWHRFPELARTLAKQGTPVVITCAPGEEAFSFDADLYSESGVYPFATTLEEFVALCEGASLFVGGDTGPLHIAASMGVPIVALFGPTSSARNGPLNQEDIVVERPLPCRPCMKRDQCPLEHWNCMEEISVEEVYAACLKRLGVP